MKKQFNIHGVELEVKSEKSEFLEFLEKRLGNFAEDSNKPDIEIEVNFDSPNFNEEEFSSLSAETKVKDNQMIYENGPLKSKITVSDKVEIEAYLDPKQWKHYGRIAKKGKERTWNEYYEYFIIRKAIQLPLMWKMQQEGFYPVHASAVEKDGKAYVFTGFGGVGKTTLGLYLAENGYRLMGDNFVFLKDGKVYPYPEMLRVTDFTLENISEVEKTGEEVFGQEIVEMDKQKIGTEPVDLEKIFLLTRGEFGHRKVENGVERLLGLADNLQEFHTHHYTSLLSFVTDQETVSREKIYRNSLENTETYTLSYSKFEDVKKLIESGEK
jgi:hypothetical protein